jgi:hypothetical protein
LGDPTYTSKRPDRKSTLADLYEMQRDRNRITVEKAIHGGVGNYL